MAPPWGRLYAVGMFDNPSFQALAVIGVLGIAVGLVGGIVAGARQLIGSMLMGAIGAIAMAAVMKIAQFDPIIGVGAGYSYLYGAAGALVLSFVVGRSDA